jgi:hypothetical protein
MALNNDLIKLCRLEAAEGGGRGVSQKFPKEAMRQESPSARYNDRDLSRLPRTH